MGFSAEGQTKANKKVKRKEEKRKKKDKEKKRRKEKDFLGTREKAKPAQQTD